MNRIFGFSRNAVALVGIILAIILVVLVGMIVVGSAAIRALMAPGLKVDGVSLLALLVTIIVLLVAVFVLLLVLFRCCCKPSGKQGDVPPDVLALLIPLVPLFQQMPNLLRDLGVALYEGGKTVTWIQAHVDAVSSDLSAAAGTLANAATFRVPGLIDAGNGLWLVDPNPFHASPINPLQDLLGTLTQLSTHLALATGAPVTLNAANQSVADVANKLSETGRALARLANTLHASPPSPPEAL